MLASLTERKRIEKKTRKREIMEIAPLRQKGAGKKRERETPKDVKEWKTENQLQPKLLFQSLKNYNILEAVTKNQTFPTLSP